MFMYEEIKEVLSRYSFLSGDGYVELALVIITPYLPDDECTREYALRLLYIITGRAEFKRELTKIYGEMQYD